MPVTLNLNQDVKYFHKNIDYKFLDIWIIYEYPLNIFRNIDAEIIKTIH